MASPQTGIFALGTSSHAYLEFDLAAGADARAAVVATASLREPRTTMGGVNIVTGFRPELWAAVAPDAAPPGAHGFDQPIVGPFGVTLPATQHDVAIWLAGASYDVVFDLSRQVARSLAGALALAHEVVGWSYHHDLDLTGFIDGTENPSLLDAPSYALIPTGSPGEGGSILLLQQWSHDADAWENQPVAAQEAVIGRTKSDSAELDPRPRDSHVSRTDQDAFGKILRRNTAYGSLTDHGTMFVGFSAHQPILIGMLESMVGFGGPPDALTRFATALTGGFYVVPSAERLAQEGPPPED